MDKFTRLQSRMLDKHLAQISVCDRPSDGWIRAVRKALVMSVRQLGERMPKKMSQQAVSRLEANEQDGSITLASLRKVAEAMDCRLVYALIPNEGSLETTLWKQAMKKARILVAPVNHTMVLEAQGVGDLEAKVKQTADDLVKNPTHRLWDV